MSTKVFVGNLEPGVTGAALAELFGESGSVREAFLPLDRETRQPRGFAFVDFETESAAAAAIARFDGYELAGRPLRVSAAQERPGGGGAFRGGAPAGGGRFGVDAPPRRAGGKAKGSRRNLRARRRGL